MGDTSDIIDIGDFGPMTAAVSAPFLPLFSLCYNDELLYCIIINSSVGLPIEVIRLCQLTVFLGLSG